MLLLNFSHPITNAQRTQIETVTGQRIDDMINVATQFDDALPYKPQLATLLARIELDAEAWQSESILIVLPSLNFIGAILLAELHGRMGYFPSIVRTRPVADSLPRRYEIAEILDLQSIRTDARKQRYP